MTSPSSPPPTSTSAGAEPSRCRPRQQVAGRQQGEAPHPVPGRDPGQQVRWDPLRQSGFPPDREQARVPLRPARSPGTARRAEGPAANREICPGQASEATMPAQHRSPGPPPGPGDRARGSCPPPRPRWSPRTRPRCRRPGGTPRARARRTAPWPPGSPPRTPGSSPRPRSAPAPPSSRAAGLSAPNRRRPQLPGRGPAPGRASLPRPRTSPRPDRTPQLLRRSARARWPGPGWQERRACRLIPPSACAAWMSGSGTVWGTRPV